MSAQCESTVSADAAVDLDCVQGIGLVGNMNTVV